MVFSPANENDELIFGRKKEIDLVLDGVKKSKSITLLTGESGVGKSKLLDGIYRRLITQEYQANFLVGYYNKDKSLISEPRSFDYPLRVALASLIEGAKSSEQIDEKVGNTLNRLKKAFVKFIKEEGVEIANAVIDDISKKAGLEETLNVIKRFWRKYKEEKTGIMAAEEAVAAKYKEDDLEFYLGIFRSIAIEFKEKSLVLLFDQFEYIGKASIDFFLNFIKFMIKERFHVILSFRTDDRTWNDPPIRRLFEDTRDILIDELGGSELMLEGLDINDIGEWIKLVRGIQLPLIPDLQRIRENSAGLPIILDDWINSSEDLNYEEITRDAKGKLCKRITKLDEILTSDEQKIKLYKLSVLLQPLEYKMLADYLEMAINYLGPFIRILVEARIFDRSQSWFRHELVQRCFEDNLSEQERNMYYNQAAGFFINLQKDQEANKQNNGINFEKADSYKIYIACAYFTYMAGMNHAESFNRNKGLAEYAYNVGDLDLAERSYRRAIDDAEKLGRTSDKMNCLRDIAHNVYHIWGRYDEALTNYQQVLNYSIEIGDSKMQANVIHNIARIHEENRGEYDQAIKLYHESLEIRKRISDEQGVADSLNNLATIHSRRGEYDQAMKLYHESLEIRKRIGDQFGVGETFFNMAVIHNSRGGYDQAMKLLNESLDTNKKLGNQYGISVAKRILSVTYLKTEKYDQAMKLLNESLDTNKKLGNQRGIGQVLNTIARVYYKKKEYNDAILMLDESLKINRKLGNQYEVGMGLSIMSAIYLLGREYKKSFSYANQGSQILERLKSPDVKEAEDVLHDIKAAVGDEEYEKLKDIKEEQTTKENRI